MLIDNKKKRYEDQDIITVWDFIKKYATVPVPKANFDIVTGYFTLRALSKLYHEIPADVEYRLLSSELLKDENDEKHIIDLLRGDEGIGSTFKLEQYVHDAKAFLLRDTVQCRAITNAFCHAKVYLFKPSHDAIKSFFLTGSSNLTDSGLGLRQSSNVELTMGKTADSSDADYRELTKWFNEIWNQASETLPVDRKKPKGERISVKEYFILQIDDFFRKYTPEEIYYKILFELFNADIDLNASIEHRQDMSLLQTSTIWKTLFNYQQKGVISLIKMLQSYNGAILADAVGLGKTFSALAVIKYFQTKGYTSVLLCPKKLEQNWRQYRRQNGSRFENDEFDYIVRFHTDFQNERLEKYPEAKLSWLQSRKKILIVIDESHNLRNEKSNRYQDLLTSLIQNQPGQEQRDVKVLMLSATPINTGLNDVKGQFNLIGHGEDDAFDNEKFNVESLKNLFKDAQAKYNSWCDDPKRTIGGFIKLLPPKFFNLTDKLIVARTRKLIETTLGENLGFPEKEKPLNVYQGVDHFGEFHSTEEIYKAFEELFLAAYQPSLFMEKTRDKSKREAKKEGWANDVDRERFLVRMMCILFMKRLESSWYSLMSTVKKVLVTHEETLDKVKKFIANQKVDEKLPGLPLEFDDDETEGDDEFFSLRKGEIKLSEMKNIGGFKKALETDVKQLNRIYLSLLDFERKYNAKTEKDVKLDELEKILREKQLQPNKKVVIFTVYADTAKFIYDELIKRGFSNIASASGSASFVNGQQTSDGFFTILQRFAPYSKLYKELDWRDLYESKANLNKAEYYNDEKQQWEVPYEKWVELIKEYEPNYAKLLNAPIDILVATDCLSEGQNLQDADMQINYDIHWNPVRLIQRFGRIDRIGSPNKLIRSVNFWPAKSFEEYLNLETRIQNRMATMTLIDIETVPFSDEYIEMVKDNPIQDKNADRLLQELQNNSISDIETPRTLSLKDFSFEVYRQDLIDYFEKNKEVFRRMPDGIFSGFSFDNSGDFDNISDSLIGVIGYPHREEGSSKPYKEIYLMCQPVDNSKPGQFKELNRAEILEFLRQNKTAERFVPEWIEKGDSENLKRLTALMQEWMEVQAPKKAVANILNIFKSPKGSAAKKTKEENNLTLDEKFQLENFDLIVWEYVTLNK